MKNFTRLIQLMLAVFLGTSISGQTFIKPRALQEKEKEVLELKKLKEIDGYKPTAAGTFVNLEGLLAPTNDLCEDAEPVDCSSGTISGTTIAATVDAVGSCDGTTVTAPGVWYLFTVTEPVYAHLDLCSSTMLWDSKLSVYEGNCGDLTCVAANDDYCSLLSGVDFMALPGTDYYVLVHGYESEVGDFQLEIACEPLYEVSGNFAYKEAGGTPMDNSRVLLFDAVSNPLGWVPTDDNGDYSFLALADDYSIEPKTYKPRGGTGLIDIVRTRQYLLGQATLSPIQQASADVDDGGTVGLLDIVQMRQFLLGQIFSWNAPDWLYESPAPFTLGSDMVLDIACICSGDPDGSYPVPYGAFLPDGMNCTDSYLIDAVPFSLTGQTTCEYGNDYGADDACTTSYMEGEDFVFEYTPAANITVDIVLTNTDNWVGVFVTEGCPDVGSCVDFATSADGNPSLNGVSLIGGVTYFIIVDTFPDPVCTAFDISITEQ